MTKSILLISTFFILFSCKPQNHQGVTIKGNVKNTDNEYVVLMHISRLRGNLNLDGFRSVGDRIDKKGIFRLNASSITDKAYYNILIKNRGISLILFQGDDINIEFDLNNIDSSFFAWGKGAGKINILRLDQFKYDCMFEPYYTMNDYKARVDSVTNAQLALLEAINGKDENYIIDQKFSNKKTMDKIMVGTPLSENEYEYLKKFILVNRVGALGEFVFYKGEINPSDTTSINFDAPYFSCFNSTEYKQIDNISDYGFETSLDAILQVECLKKKQNEGVRITIGNLMSNLYRGDYLNWILNYLKDNFNPEVFATYCAHQLASDLTLLATYNDFLYQFLISNSPNSKYLKCLDEFNNLLKTGLNNTEFNLGESRKTLTGESFDSLLNSHNKIPVYLVLWSAQFAGASLIPGLPSVIDFEKTNRKYMKVIYICIDEEKYKNLWAARIIDNNWKGNHYFLPKEGNDTITKRYGAEKLFSFCNDGVTYTLIDSDGNVINDYKSPLLMVHGKIEGNNNE